DLRERALKIMQPHYAKRLNELIGQYRQATAKELSADQIDEIVKDAFDGKVGALLLEEDRIIPGRIIDRDTVIYPASDTEMLVDDVLDDLAELVMRYGGEGWVGSKERLSSGTGGGML